MQDIKEWIGAQWGDGTPYGSPRELALAISDDRNQNIVADIERKGVLTFKAAAGVARATKVSVLRVLMMAGLVDEAEVAAISGQVLTVAQEKAANLVAKLPEEWAEALLESGETQLELLARRGGLGRVADESPEYQAGSG